VSGIGGASDCVWHYQGVIRNTLSGSEVVTIEGVERVGLVDASWKLTLPWKKTCPPDAFEAPFASYISNKLFVYTNASDPDEAIYAYRVSRQAPERPVRPVKHLLEKITVGTKEQAPTEDRSTSTNTKGKGRTLLGRVTFPGGRTLTSKNFDFTVAGCIGRGNTGSGALGRKQVELVHFMRPTPAPKRPKTALSRWVSFAPGPSPDAARTLESYTARRDSAFAQPRMVCRRQGECPPWYAPGRQCSTEITAVRYSSLSKVPPRTRRLLRGVAPEEYASLRLPCNEVLLTTGTDSLAKYPTWYDRVWRRKESLG